MEKTQLETWNLIFEIWKLEHGKTKMLKAKLDNGKYSTGNLEHQTCNLEHGTNKMSISKLVTGKYSMLTLSWKSNMLVTGYQILKPKNLKTTKMEKMEHTIWNLENVKLKP